MRLQTTSTLESFFQTLTKIRNFKKLPHGWRYGKGVAPSEETIKLATSLLVQTLANGLTRTDAFAGADGEIQLTVYSHKSYLEFTVEPDARVTAVYEKEGVEKGYAEDLSFDEAAIKLKEFSREIWDSFDLYITGTSTTTKKDSLASLLKTLVMELASQSSTPTVPCKRAKASVNTFGDFILNRSASLQSSGTFQKECLAVAR